MQHRESFNMKLLL